MHIPFQLVEFRILFERAHGELQQPRTHHAAVHPEIGDAPQIQFVLAFGHQLKAFRIALHHTVFDSIVDHFDIVTCPDGTDVGPSIVRSQGLEQRSEPLHCGLFPSNHEAVADFQSPDSSAGACVDVVDPLWFQCCGSPHVVVKSGIAAVDDRVPWFQQCRHGLYCFFRRCAGGNHDPDGTRCTEFAYQVGKRRRTDTAMAFGLVNEVVRSVIDDYAVLIAA